MSRIPTPDVYDALTDSDTFEALPALLARRFGARSALLAWHHADGGEATMADSGYFEPGHLRDYAATFAPHDPWLTAARARGLAGVTLNLERLVPVPAYESSFFYNEFIRAIGDDTVRAIGAMTANRFGTGLIALHRGKAQESFVDDDVAKLDREARHLRRMLAVRARIAAHGRRSQALEAILDSIRDSALLVQPDGILFYANAAAERTLERAEALRLRQRRLRAAASTGDRWLQQALQAATRANEPEAGAVLLDRRSGPPLVATVTPFRSPDGRRFALVLAHDDQGPVDSLAPELRRLFRLTQAESEIALRLADGLTPVEIAEERAASPQTVRTQVKSVCAKLGCRRQSEVVALIKSLPLPRGR